MITTEDIQLLTTCFSFWDSLCANEKDSVLKNTSLVKYHEGSSIHSGNHDCAGVLVVKSGVLRVYILSEEGKEITLYRLYKGELCILSASCLLQNITFDVHIDAEVDSEILLLPSSTFAQLSEQNIYVEAFSYKSAVDRFSDVMWAMQQILFMSFDKRLATFLMDEMSKSNDDAIHLTHEQIAKYMGSAREVVSRMLKYFATEGIVTLSRGVVKIVDKKKLRSLI